MEKLSLNSNIWYIKFYMYLMNKRKYELPKDICTLRRSLIQTFLIFSLIAPLWLLWVQLERYANSVDITKPFGLLLSNLFIVMMSILIINDKVPLSTLDNGGMLIIVVWIFASVIALAVIILLVSIVLIIISFFNYIGTKMDKPKTNMGGIKHPKKISLFKRLYNSYKEKFCTPIDWK